MDLCRVTPVGGIEPVTLGSKSAEAAWLGSAETEDLLERCKAVLLGPRSRNALSLRHAEVEQPSVQGSAAASHIVLRPAI